MIILKLDGHIEQEQRNLSMLFFMDNASRHHPLLNRTALETSTLI